MFLPRQPETNAWQGWLSRHGYTAGLALLFVIVAVPFVTRDYSEWELVYVQAAGRLAAGGHLYKPAEGYLYPPFMAWAALPFTHLPAGLGRWLWLGINLACLAGLFRWGWQLAGGPRLQGAGAAGWPEHAACLLGAVGALPHLHNCLAHQQTDVVIAALLVGGCLLWARERSLLAATAFGLAAACKCTALLWAPYLLYRGRPVAAAWVVALALGVNLLPDLTHAHPQGRPWVREYAEWFLRPMTRAEHMAGTWGSELIYNQSLAGAGQRWLCTTWECQADRCTVTARADGASPGALRRAVYGADLTLLLLVLLVAGRPFRSLAPAEQGTVPKAALEGGVVLLLMLLLSPMSSKAHFGVLLVPGFCLARAALDEVRRGKKTGRLYLACALLAVAVGLGGLANKDLLGGRWYTLALWYGSATWQALALLAGCLLFLKGRKVEAVVLPARREVARAA
jgi:hypothetical protein